MKHLALFPLTCLLAISVQLAAQPNPGFERPNRPANLRIPADVSDLKPIRMVRGANAFTTQFNRTATGRNDRNAYLLSYITTLVYPQYLAIAQERFSNALVDRLHTNKIEFENEYKRSTSFLFPAGTEYRFFTESNSLGYDPEAMVISTPEALYVVFRGTDRVASSSRNSFVGRTMYDWGEWITTDFDAFYTSPKELKGDVHRGFWNSLTYNSFHINLFQYLSDKGGKTKPVWVTGHSLGSAHAQLFAMYMARRGMPAQGVHLLASPHPGNQEFAEELDRLYPGSRLQRFDFSNDPITTVAPYSWGYRRAGTRVFYSDISTMQFDAPERSELDALHLASGLLGAITNKIGLVKFSLTGSQICYHHPTWYLQAAFSQLSKNEKANVPLPLPVPDETVKNDNAEACDALTIRKGIRASDPGSILEEVAVNLRDGLEKLAFAASNLMENVSGTAIAEGDYYIKSYAAGGRIGLKRTGGLSNGGVVELQTVPSKVSIRRFGTIGYSISFGSRKTTGFWGNEEVKHYVLDSDMSDLFDREATTVQVWEQNAAAGVSANQRWIFYRVKDNRFVIQNLANGKLLDANNRCLQDNQCGVKTWNPIDNDQSQIWILEKVN